MDETDSIFFRRSVYLFIPPQIVFSLDVQFIYSFHQQIQLTKLLYTCITKLLRI